MEKVNLIKSLGQGVKKAFVYKDGEIIVDIDSRKIIINNRIYKFEDIIDCQLTSKDEHDASVDLVNAFNAIQNKTTSRTKTSSLVGRSLIGGAIGGTTGALLGGLTAERTIEQPVSYNSTYSDFYVIVTVNSLINSTETLHVGASSEKASEIYNLFRVIISQVQDGKKIETIDRNSYLRSLYLQADEAKGKISISRKSVLKWDKNLPVTEDLFEQIFINDIDNPKAIFYHFFFSSIKNQDNYAHHFSTLFNAYIANLAKYLKAIKIPNEEFPIFIKTLYRDTRLYAKFLGGGYIDEVSYEYKLLLKVGDTIADILSENYALDFWEEGISLNHSAGFYNKKKSKEELSQYIEKINRLDDNYVEPHFDDGANELTDPYFWLGLLFVIAVIVGILYFLFS